MIVYPIDLYYEPSYNDDLLYLTYLITKNIKEILRIDQIIVIPKEVNYDLYNKILENFSNFMNFYKNLEPEGEYKNEIFHFKHRFTKLSLISAYELFKKLKEGKKEEVISYNLESSQVGIKANDLAACKGFKYAPKTLGEFYKKYKNKVKYLKMKKEAKETEFNHNVE
ncbi:hypothetical protein NBO_72g0018 [Nosema bombycis CQ1]|uniref:Uncharacterized protein n=1 Tax=Nosema bombycis (strain CQ1 / CVCC 102059) TaxID=578461 RepID=R0M673_NOSB1|nr:hypothetical protein NBO_72g0018 [Nosema bombycis CQ1]|eukprot:EOB13484.1 hypothetical protein NBO_72g0018 [Nosema bombycis CQ1]